MTNRIKKVFKDKKKGILSVFYTAGFPQLDSTIPVAEALASAGADIIEIGIPFSDPVADGPTIQASNKVALENGMNLRLIITQVKEIRKNGVDIPIILMGYLNPIIQYGITQFIDDAAKAGVDGVILPDMPVYEFEECYRDLFKKAGLCNTFLISPTTNEDRIRRLDAATEGFIYAVSASSITGAKTGFTETQVSYFERLAKMKLHNPFLIGFGISDNATYSTACKYGAGAIVGSAFVNLLKESKDLKNDITQFVRRLKG